MPQITIPQLDHETLRHLESEAMRRGTDVGTTAGELLRERFRGASSGDGGRADLRSLAGTWSDEEAAAFLAAVEGFGRVDPELWK